MPAKKIPKGFKQISLILPAYIVDQLDKICQQENRKRPGQIQHWIEKYSEVK